MSESNLPEETLPASPGFFSIPFWIAPAPDVFAQRGRRLRELVAGSEWPGYLDSLAALCDVQHRVLARLPDIHEPADALSMDVVESCWDVWEAELAATNLPATLRVSWNAWRALTPKERQSQLVWLPEKIWAVLLLQTLWVRANQSLPAPALPTEPGYCPRCGEDGVGSVIKTGALAGLRYLHCPKCQGQWHVVRAQCTFCGNMHGVSQHKIDHDGPPWRGVYAECCPSCQAYRKLYRLDESSQLDPIADDLATLALDMLLADNWMRGGANPFLHEARA